MPVKENTKKLYKAIKRDFSNFQNEKHNGIQKYNTKYIISRLADKYFKSASTIENIVYGRIG